MLKIMDGYGGTILEIGEIYLVCKTADSNYKTIQAHFDLETAKRNCTKYQEENSHITYFVQSIIFEPDDVTF